MRKIIPWTRVISWPLLFAVIWMIFATVIPPFQALVRTIVVFLFFRSIVWVNIAVLIPAFVERRKFFVYIVLAVASATALALVRVVLESRLGIQLHPFFNRSMEVDQYRYTFLIVVNHLIAIAVALLYHFAGKWSDANRREALLRSDNLEAELRSLRAQVSPHFLFNTLNNIYTLCYLKDDKAPGMVLKLAELMRYLIDQGQSGEVSLAGEVRFLDNYLELQKLKSSVFQRIVPEIRGDLEHARIPPLLLLPFFENLFKHSDLESNPHGWASVRIVLDENRRLHLSLANTWKAETADGQRSGFGIANLTKRLLLLYGNSYVLNIKRDSGIFEVNLTLPLR